MAKNVKFFNSCRASSHSERVINNTSTSKVDYSLEQERIKSFVTWPVHNPIDPRRLAKAGFYYSGHEDEVICFSCQGHIKNWNYGDIVLKKHTELFPNCDFVNGRSKNIPITETNRQNRNIHCNLVKRPSTHDSLSSKQLSKIMSSINYDKMKSKIERLKSFKTGWHWSNVTVEDLAEAGFFYLGIADKVQCPFCKGVVSNWEDGDDPLLEHKRHFPSCGYVLEVMKKKSVKWYDVKSNDVCGNGSTNPNTLHVFHPHRFFETHKVVNEDQIHTSLEKLGVQPYNSPAYPELASLSTRLRSFDSWPEAMPVCKEDLATAGFFYVGTKDQTKCFHCGGGLYNWETDDDPWIEHARWYCNCPYVRLNKGDEFIKNCYQLHTPSNEESLIKSSPTEHSIIDLDEAMKTDMVKNCLESGLFPEYIVRVAVLRQLRETGSAFTDENELCLAVSYLKEEMETLSLKSYKAPELDLNNVNIRTSVDIESESNDNISDSTANKLTKKMVDYGNGTLLSNKQESESNDNISDSTANKLTNSSCEITNHATRSSLEKTKENEVLKSPSSDKQCLCIICMNKEVGIVFLPCGHLLACTECATSMGLCPMCRKTIRATVRVYLP